MKTLTPEQIKKRDERRSKFRTLVKQVADMPEFERVQIANRFGLRTVEGHELSLCNTMLVYMQNPKASMVGGFRQWINAGRAVRKGEHGAMIWVPIGKKPESPTGALLLPEFSGQRDEEARFLIGTVFDIAQTDAIQTEKPQPDSDLVAA